jgi:hypothetical protein
LRFWLAKYVALVLCCFVAEASGQEASELKAEVLTIADGAKALLASDTPLDERTKSTQLTRRLNDGQVFYLQGEYSRAAIVLMDLVKRPGVEGHPAYSDIVYYLSDALFMMGNDRSAATFLKKLQRKAGKRRRDWATGRLLQICVRRSDVDFCEENRTSAFQQINDSSLSSLKYALGKSLYKNGQLSESERVFRLVKPDESEWAKAKYFIGVIQLRTKKYEQAKQEFEVIVKRFANEPPLIDRSEDKEIYNLARLAVARVLYEQNTLPQSRDQYNQVETDSHAYDAAHYESIWLSIKEGNYKKSLRDLELFMIKQEDVTKGYKAHLLKGRLLILLERFTDAQASFAQVTDAFLPIRNQLETTIKANPDLEAHFQQKVGANITDIDMSSLVPQAAADAVGTELNADAAIVLVQEVGTQRRYVEAARRTVGKLRNALASDMRLDMFPTMQRRYLTASEFLNRALLAEANLNNLIGRELGNAVYVKAKNERIAIEAQFRKTPISANDFKARRVMMNAKLRQLDMSVNQLNVELTSVDAQLTALRQFQRVNPAVASAKGIDAEFDQVGILRKKLRALVWSLEDERTKLGAADYAAAKDLKIRRRFRNALETESRLLSQLKPRQTRLRESLAGSMGYLDRYLASIRTKVAALMSDLRSDVEAEAKRLDTFEAELRIRERDTSRLGGAIAASTFKRIYGSIRKIVLEADVGLVNMAWKRKQDESASIRRYQELKNEKIGRVEALFSEVSGE